MEAVKPSSYRYKKAADKVIQAKINQNITNDKMMSKLDSSVDKSSEDIRKRMGNIIDTKNNKTEDALSSLSSKLDEIQSEHGTLAKKDKAGVGANKGDSKINITSNLAANPPVTSQLDTAPRTISNINRGSIRKGPSVGPSGISVIPNKNMNSVVAAAVDSMDNILYRIAQNKLFKENK